jgi:hypothetical protein
MSAASKGNNSHLQLQFPQITPPMIPSDALNHEFTEYIDINNGDLFLAKHHKLPADA